MKCPFCGHSDDRVLDTRVQREGEQIRRRRECIDCKGRFSTVESIMEVYPHVVKKDGRREAFDKEKLIKGIHAACQKRPVSRTQIEQIVEKVARWVHENFDKELPSSMIGHKVMKELRVLDDVAYVRFASVYRQFKDVDEFLTALRSEPSSTFEKEDHFKLTPPPSE